MFYQWDFAFLLRYTPLFWKGVLVTLAYTVGTISSGWSSACCSGSAGCRVRSC